MKSNIPPCKRTLTADSPGKLNWYLTIFPALSWKKGKSVPLKAQLFSVRECRQHSNQSGEKVEDEERE